MEDLRKKQQQENIFWSNTYKYLLKNKWWVISILLISIIAFFPETSGATLGQWFHDFFGNLIKYGKI